MTSKIKKRSEDQNQSGFTLIEILVVIGLIAFLAAVVIIAINPARQFARAHFPAREQCQRDLKRHRPKDCGQQRFVQGFG